MFARSVQPDVVSLFSSTGSDPLGLFGVHVDDSLPSDSFIHLLNDSTSLPTPTSPATLITPPSVFRGHHTTTSQGHELNQTVLHIQSPTVRNTFIISPSAAPADALGLQHNWLHIQVRNLGRDWSFDVGIVDKTGRRGTLRCSTFQKSPKLVRNHGTPPLLHLPLAFPSPTSNPLTAWSTITLHLPKFIPQFASLAHIQATSEVINERPPTETGETSGQVPLPSGTYSHLSFIKIYATCRLRRIWLSEPAPITKIPWEFELYGD